MFNREVRLKDWYVSVPEYYKSPERRRVPAVSGVVVESLFNKLIVVLGRKEPRHRGGRITEPIYKAVGRRLTAENGTVFVLIGDPLPQWIEKMKNNRCSIDLKNPIDTEYWMI